MPEEAPETHPSRETKRILHGQREEDERKVKRCTGKDAGLILCLCAHGRTQEGKQESKEEKQELFGWHLT